MLLKTFVASLLLAAASSAPLWSCDEQRDIPRQSIQWPRPKSGWVQPIEVGLKLTSQITQNGNGFAADSVIRAWTDLIDEISRVNTGPCSPAISGLTEVVVNVDNMDALLAPGVDESYTLSLQGGVITITAPTQYGARHGIITLQNMFEMRSCSSDFKFENTDYQVGGYLVLPFTDLNIDDAPRLSHRGVMVDTARGYITMDTMKRILYVMSRTKLNVFHWHATDDQAFPLVMPKSAGAIHGADAENCYLSDNAPCAGAYSNLKVYTASDIQEIVTLGKELGIRIIFEVDMPSHARSWASSDVSLVDCYALENQVEKPTNGPLSLQKNFLGVLTLAKAILDDLSSLALEGELLHVGMDEVRDGCWGAEASRNLTLQYLEEITDYATNTLHRRVMVWQDVLNNNPPSVVKEAGVIPQVWDDADKGYELLQSGFDIVWSMADGMYLDCGRGNPFIPHWDTWCNPFKKWWDVYVESPDLLYPDVAEHILGGEVCLWAEQVNHLNVETLLWPRAWAWGGAAWETRDRVPQSWDTFEFDILKPQDELKRLSFAMFRQCVPFTPITTMWCHYGDSVGGGSVSGPEFCDKFATRFFTPPPTTTTSTASTSSSSTSDNGDCVCPSPSTVGEESGSSAFGLANVLAAVIGFQMLQFVL